MLWHHRGRHLSSLPKPVFIHKNIGGDGGEGSGWNNDRRG